MCHQVKWYCLSYPLVPDWSESTGLSTQTLTVLPTPSWIRTFRTECHFPRVTHVSKEVTPQEFTQHKKHPNAKFDVRMMGRDKKSPNLVLLDPPCRVSRINLCAWSVSPPGAAFLALMWIRPSWKWKALTSHLSRCLWTPEDQEERKISTGWVSVSLRHECGSLVLRVYPGFDSGAASLNPSLKNFTRKWHVLHLKVQTFTAFFFGAGGWSRVSGTHLLGRLVHDSESLWSKKSRDIPVSKLVWTTSFVSGYQINFTCCSLKSTRKPQARGIRWVEETFVQNEAYCWLDTQKTLQDSSSQFLISVFETENVDLWFPQESREGFGVFVLASGSGYGFSATIHDAHKSYCSKTANVKRCKRFEQVERYSIDRSTDRRATPTHSPSPKLTTVCGTELCWQVTFYGHCHWTWSSVELIRGTFV